MGDKKVTIYDIAENVKYEIITEKTLKTGFSGYSPDFFKKFTA